jgi:hypothetical protein
VYSTPLLLKECQCALLSAFALSLLHIGLTAHFCTLGAKLGVQIANLHTGRVYSTPLLLKRVPVCLAWCFCTELIAFEQIAQFLHTGCKKWSFLHV